MSTTKLCVGSSSVIALILSTLPSWGQVPLGYCGPDCQARVEQKFNAAKELYRQQQWESAAQMFASVIAEEPLSIISLDSAVRAATALENAGKHAEALTFYDQAISIAEARASEPSRSKAATLKRLKRTALFQRIVAWERAGNQDAAAEARQQAIDDVFAELAAEVPSADMHQENAANLQSFALNVALYLEGHGEPDRAIAAYNHIIAISDARGDTADGENLRSLLNAKRDALLKKAIVCEAHGCRLEAIQAIERVHEEFPASSHSRVIEAKLYNRPMAEAELQTLREQQAKTVLNQAFASPTPEGKIAGADVVIAGFPDTAAALVAMDKKACLLDDLKRVEEAEIAFTELLDRLRPTSSRSELFKSTRVRLKNLLANSIKTELYAKQMPSEQRWDQFRAVCNEIIAQDTRSEEAAWTWVTLAESYGWQKQFAESQSLAEQFLAQHDPARFPGQTFEAHWVAGITAQQIGQYDTSFAHLRWITQRPDHDTMTDDGKKLVIHAYHAIWAGLRQSGASPEEVSQARQEFDAKQVQLAN